MSFLTQTATTFVKLKLTDLGKRKMSQGTFNLATAIFSDREVNYRFNQRYPDTKGFAGLNVSNGNLFESSNNFILSPGFDAPNMPSRNFDGTLAYDISEKITFSEETLTARTESKGLWSAVTEGSLQKMGKYMLDPSKYKFSGSASADDFPSNGNILRVSPNGIAENGDLLYIRYVHPQANLPNVAENDAVFSLMYRIVESQPATSPYYDYTLDRNTLDFIIVSSINSFVYVYPYSAATDYWNSGTTEPGDVWSFACVRTNSEIGTTSSMIQNGSGYTTYGSREFSGTKRFFGFDADQRAVGFIWHEDNYTGKTYGDFFVPKSTQLDLPDVMWHRKLGRKSGEAKRQEGGHRFVDYKSKIHYDEKAKSNYTILYDGVDVNRIAVGRVYYELQIIVITHHDLLVAMSYKANRNFTLPKLKVDLRETHKDAGSTPFIEDGKTYYFTYQIASSDRDHAAQLPLPCAEWAKVNGITKADGTKYFPAISFPSDGFPYLRTISPFNSKFFESGTGFLLRKIQILMNEVNNSEEGAALTADRVRTNRWSACTNGTLTASTNGHLDGGQFGIQPQVLSTKVFNPRKEDFGFGVGFDFEGNSNYYVIPASMRSWMDYQSESGLTFGNETFLNGNVKTTFGIRTQKIIVTINLEKERLNDSLTKSGRIVDQDGNIANIASRNISHSFGGGHKSANAAMGNKSKAEKDAYITEIGLFSDDGKLMATGKPTRPIKKSKDRHLIFQLEINI